MKLAFVIGLLGGFIGSIPIAGPAAVLVVERTLARHGRAAMGSVVITIVNPTLIVTWSAVVTILQWWGLLRIAPLDGFPFGLAGRGVAGMDARLSVPGPARRPR